MTRDEITAFKAANTRLQRRYVENIKFNEASRQWCIERAKGTQLWQDETWRGRYAGLLATLRHGYSGVRQCQRRRAELDNLQPTV